MKVKKSALILMSVLVMAALLVVGCDDASSNSTSDTSSFSGYVDSVLGGTMSSLTVDDVEYVLVSGSFGTDMTWENDYTYILADSVFIGGDNADNCTLTIEEGTTILGSVSTTDPGCLIVTRGSKINAVGTADAPIVFTSAADEGSRESGDWGGIVICGNAQINDGDDNGEAEGEGSTGTYGGDDDTDDSGILQYVRVEFAGTLFSEDNELNGIAFQAVGSGTTVDHIQVHMNADDGVEFFGGAVNVSHVVITGAGDDSFDWTSGWTGTADYVILQQYDGIGDCGIEADSTKLGDGAAGYTPVSNPTLSNFTVIGGNSGTTALKFRRYTDATLYNFIVTGFDTVADENSKDTDAGTITYDGIIADMGTANADAVDFAASTNVSVTGTLSLPAAALSGANESSIDVQPTADATGATSSTSATGDFLGAVDADAATAWYADWTSTPAN